jgi:hypothetical protein
VADQRAITLYPGDASPKDIVLRPLPLADIAAGPVCYLYPVSAPVSSGSDPRNITLYPVTAGSRDITLYPMVMPSAAPLDVVIMLRSLGAPIPEEPPPPESYYGILKRWTGGAWAKEPLKTYVGGTWQSKPLYFWDGSAWRLVDTSGA